MKNLFSFKVMFILACSLSTSTGFSGEPNLSFDALKVVDELSGKKLFKVMESRISASNKTILTQKVIVVASDENIDLPEGLPVYYLKGKRSWASLGLVVFAKGAILAASSVLGSYLGAQFGLAAGEERVEEDPLDYELVPEAAKNTVRISGVVGGIAGFSMGLGAGINYVYGDSVAQDQLDLESQINSLSSWIYPIAFYDNRNQTQSAFNKIKDRLINEEKAFKKEIVLIVKNSLYSRFRELLKNAGYRTISVRR